MDYNERNNSSTTAWDPELPESCRRPGVLLPWILVIPLGLPWFVGAYVMLRAAWSFVVG